MRHEYWGYSHSESEAKEILPDDDPFGYLDNLTANGAHSITDDGYAVTVEAVDDENGLFRFIEVRVEWSGASGSVAESYLLYRDSAGGVQGLASMQTEYQRSLVSLPPSVIDLPALETRRDRQELEFRRAVAVASFVQNRIQGREQA